MIAAAYGAQHPECPGAVNLDGHGLGRPEQYLGQDEADVRAWWKRQQRLVARLNLVVLAITPIAKVLRKRVPSPKATRELQAAVDETDLLALYRSVRCPLLVFNATADENRPMMLRLIGKEGLSMLQAYRNGLRHDLKALADENPRVEVVEVDATHMLITTHPVEVAQHIDRFLLSHG